MDTLSLSPTRWIRRSPRLRQARRRLFYGSVRGLAGVVSHLPRPVSVGALRGLAEVAWRTRRGDRRTALTQLERAFPDASPTQRHRLGRASLHTLARNLVDAVRDDAPVHIHATDAARLRALLDGERPVLFLTAHLGCWEVLGRFLARTAGRLGVLTANPHNPAVYQWLTAERARHGLVAFDRDHEGRAAARWLARGRPLAILADLRTRGAGMASPWFGHPAPTVLTPGRWARRFGAELVPVGIRREGDGHRVWLGPTVELDDDDATLTARCNRALESMIREAPTEWVWIHDRYGNEGTRA